VESPAKRQSGWLAGKNPQFKTVVFDPCGARIRDIVDVRIESTGPHTLRGRQVTERGEAPGGAHDASGTTTPIA
jgi:hypothetical protein